ncbi:hypothetical protein MUO32_08185 [Shinella sp. CPCC 101442]|uniref:hypothetical protein n=1 Tax=Shinella sp. CPCC 101442 TaxID=2932265 RepID=UPI0021521C7B|nr:hypothetical protein [Shinella sp. CPCC 101442]MCR6499006.1 hypothetical protein [Shinella sp. CPCC 101442]
MNRGMTHWGLCLRMLCAVALLFVGFAHRPAMAAMPAGLEMAQYVLPDGSIADLCLNDMVDGKTKQAVPGKCDACRIGGAMLTPEPATFAVTVLTFRRIAALPLVEEALRSKRDRPGAPPRAPPFLSV